jgi:hypothetical protein
MNFNKKGFAAGTLVHTDKGLVPIQELKIGDRVLSRHESGEGALAFKRVTQTFFAEDQPLRGMIIAGPSNAEGKYHQEFLFSTESHPFWQADYTDINKGKWISAFDLEIGDGLLEVSRKYATVIENIRLYETLDTNKAFYMVDPDSDNGIFLDFEQYLSHNLEVVDYITDESFITANVDENEDPVPDEFRRSVYSLDVEDFHTCFVGEIGVWVQMS